MRDGHIHSHYCPHGSNDPFEVYVENAIKIGLKEITFTEHLPLPEDIAKLPTRVNSAMKEDELLNYFKEVKTFKGKYKDKIKINIGLEVDFIEGYEEYTKEKLDLYGKYIEDAILSIHMISIDSKHYCVDSGEKEFQIVLDKLGSIEKVYDKYYETVKLAINSDLGKYKPKRIGHLNLVRKYNKLFTYDYSKNKILEDIVKLIKEKNYELDFNVSGLRKPYCKEAYISGYLLELVNKYKVKTVYGSDSHCSDDIFSLSKFI